YTKMAARATQLWKEHKQLWKRRILHPIGVLWMAKGGDDEFERGSLAMLRDAGTAYEELSAMELARRWPQINFEGVGWGIYEQDVFFFGTPAGDDRFSEDKLPAWADHRDRFIYGIPGNEGRGFKIADDTRGPEFDPTAGERIISEENLATVREYLSFRFPAMK